MKKVRDNRKLGRRGHTYSEDARNGNGADLWMVSVVWEVMDAGRTIAHGTAMAAFKASSLICTAESNKPADSSQHQRPRRNTSAYTYKLFKGGHEGYDKHKAIWPTINYAGGETVHLHDI